MKSRNPENVRLVLFVLLTLAYIIGQTLQWIEVGPVLVRNYLADFGRPFMVAILVIIVFKVPTRIALLVGIVASVLSEALQFARGVDDPFDLIMFAIAGIIGFNIIRSTQ